MDEGLNSRTADRTIVILHANDLTAALAQAQVSAWQDDRVLYNGEADDTFSLHVIIIAALVLLAIHVCQIKDGPVVEQLLLE